MPYRQAVDVNGRVKRAGPVRTRFVGLVLVGSCLAAGPTGRPDGGDRLTLDRFARYVAALQNLSVAYTEQAEVTPRVADRGTLRVDGRRVEIKAETYLIQGRFALCGGRALIECDPQPASVDRATRAGDDLVWQRTLVEGERTEVLTRHLNGRQVIGHIAGGADVPDDLVLDVGLGVRPFKSGRWLTPEVARAMSVIDVAGPLATVRWVDPAGLVHQWGLTLTAAATRVDSYRFGDAAGRTFVEVANSDFDPARIPPLPRKVVVRHTFNPHARPGERPVPAVVETDTYALTDVAVDDPHNTSDLYRMVWPLGCTVIDRRTGKTFEIRTAPRSLSDKDIASALDRAATPAATPAATEPAGR